MTVCRVRNLPKQGLCFFCSCVLSQVARALCRVTCDSMTFTKLSRLGRQGYQSVLIRSCVYFFFSGRSFCRISPVAKSRICHSEPFDDANEVMFNGLTAATSFGSQGPKFLRSTNELHCRLSKPPYTSQYRLQDHPCNPTQTSGPLSSFGVLPAASADTSEPDWRSRQVGRADEHSFLRLGPLEIRVV